MNVTQKIYTDGRIETGNWKMDLKQMQEFVGGYIEICPSKIAHRCLVINEEGLLIDLPHNHEATKLAHPNTYIIDALRGNVLVAKR